jgi:signal transduction histidine kinase
VRLAVAGLLLLGVIFLGAFFGLSVLFERHVERRVGAELRVHLDQIVASLRQQPDGRLSLDRQPVDPRFNEPLSGLYWQIESAGTVLRSRSLWDGELRLAPLDPGSSKALRIAGPPGRTLFVVEREVVGGARLANRAILVAVAVDTDEIDRAAAAFRGDMAPYFLVFGVLLIAANLVQIRIGLKPLHRLRDRISGIRNGSLQRMGNDFPQEILPLTAEVDALLASREEQLVRARRQAADLAHGLKTPLQALSGDVERLRSAGQGGMADDIGGSIRIMRRHIDHQLARARMADRTAARATPVMPVLSSVLGVLERTPHGMLCEWRIDVADDITVQMDGDDLAELLGNLCDNAARYAAGIVDIAAKRQGPFVELAIRDDGPGIPPAKLEHVVQRGKRLDSTSGGAGLGLAIVSEIVLSCGGELSLGDAAPGLRVTVRLPAPTRNRVS